MSAPVTRLPQTLPRRRKRRGSWLPRPLVELQRELESRLCEVPTRLNEYGFDPFGADPRFGLSVICVFPPDLFPCGFR